ncbi:MAG: Crp/Fnr family transcriptional regulator [Flavobacteriales bacterium]|nr:Crp/Fnr family transcriptional regulator [Flavobacteriales bacterium]
MSAEQRSADLAGIRSYLDHFHALETTAWHDLTDALRERRFGKGEVITGVGDIQRDLLFILEGVQYSYFLKDDKPYVMAFTYPISISGIPESFLSQQPSTYTLETISATRARALPHADLMRLFDAHPSIERLLRKITEVMLIAAAHGRYRQVSTSVEERFQQFAQQSAHLFQLVPHKLIASYLGIHPTNFSKLYNSIRI